MGHNRRLALVRITVLLAVLTAACGEADTPRRSQSSPTSSETGSHGPGATTDVDTTGTSPTLAPPPTFAPGESGVTGVVGRNPCPTGDQRACDARPEPLVATVVVKARQSDNEVTRAVSAANGRYAIRLAAGDYRLEADPAASDLSCASLDIVVPKASYLETNIECH
jgi:hypothetical protein